LIIEQNEVLGRWKQHFEETINREQPINRVIIHEEECNPVLTGIKTGPITREEIKTAMKQNEKWKSSWQGQHRCRVVKSRYGNCRDIIERFVHVHLIAAVVIVALRF